jgi:acyl-CoA hydrolase
MAKKTKKYADGGDIYEGTDLARAMGVRGVPEPGLEAVYPEEYMGGVGSIKGVGGSAMKAVAPKKLTKNIVDKVNKNPEALSMGERKLVRDNAIARAETTMEDGVKVTKMPYMGKAGEAVAKRPKPNYPSYEEMKAAERSNQAEGLRGMRARDTAEAKELSDLGKYKKGGAVKAKAKPKSSSASKRADGCAIRGKTRGRNI